MHQHLHGRVVLLLALACACAAVLAQTSTGVAGANPEAGAVVFEQCRVCHTYGPEAAHLVGPNLWQIVGRDIASQPGFVYSSALRALSGGWSPAALDVFLKHPAQYAPGTRMVFAGIADPKARSDLIAFLAVVDDTPLKASARQAVTQSDSFGDDWPRGVGREETGVVCSGCHSLAIVKQQGLSLEDWDELLVWMVEEQGMPELSRGVRENILGFLAKNYGRDRKR